MCVTPTDNYAGTAGKYRLTGTFDSNLYGLSLRVRNMVRNYHHQMDLAWLRAFERCDLALPVRRKRDV